MAYTIGAACTGCTACVQACPVEAISGLRQARHVIDPGRCIECGACGRVCPASAVQDDRGATVARRMPRASWEKPVFDLSRCISCAVCEDKCPAGCIAVEGGRPGGIDARPVLARPAKCVSCGWCALFCPMSCIEMGSPETEEASA
jgi:formate hydrogenlyase subunit 6/NADH:ubiquinone oxidoreductase subunit I